MSTEEEIIENTAKLRNLWRPQKRMKLLIDRFDQTQIYAFFAKNIMDDRVLINSFLTVIKR